MTTADSCLPRTESPSVGARRWTRLIGEVLLVAITIMSASITLFDPSSPGRWAGFTAAFLPALFLWLRHRCPIRVLVACVVLFAVAVFYSLVTPASMLPTAVALYSFVVQHPRKHGFYVAAATALLLTILAWLSNDGGRFDPEPFPIAVSIAFVAALADAVRNRRDYITEIVARADRAEATRESEAARRVSEERLRIARDLHDVVAHQISVISLNASIALTSLEGKPDQTRAALNTIRGASRRVLGDIGDLLTVLRSDDEPSLDPQPGIRQLPDLTEDFIRTGLAVAVRHEGGVPRLAPTADMVAYRAVQEALTNAAKHGSESRAHVLVASTGEDVELIVTNPTDANRFEGDGFGLSGMRERVASVRGTMDITVKGGIFRLELHLPSDTGLHELPRRDP